MTVDNMMILTWAPAALTTLIWAYAEYMLTWWWPFKLTLAGLTFLALSALSQELQSRLFTSPAASDGKDTCLVTGGTHGIGFAIAQVFARDGYNLILIARYEDELQEAKEKLQKINSKINVILIAKDLYKEKGADEVFADVKSNEIMNSKKLRLNNVVNNVGICARGDFLELPLIDQLGMMQLNMMNCVKLTHMFGNEFKQQIKNTPNSNIKFRFMHTASFASLIVCPFLSVYSGTKAFLHAFSISFNEELKASKYHDRMSSTSLCPGYTITPALPPAGIPHSVALKLQNFDYPSRVAYGGYRAMMQNKPYVLIGFFNNLTYWLTCVVLPISWTSKMGKFFNMDWEELSFAKLKDEGMQVKRGWTENQPASADLRSSLAQQ